MFYGFLLNMWCMGKLTEEELRTYVPFYITEQEADAIVITPKWEGYNPDSLGPLQENTGK